MHIYKFIDFVDHNLKNVNKIFLSWNLS